MMERTPYPILQVSHFVKAIGRLLCIVGFVLFMTSNPSGQAIKDFLGWCLLFLIVTESIATIIKWISDKYD